MKRMKFSSLFGFFAVLAAAFFLLPKTADAKVPEVIWAEEMLLANDETNDLLRSGGDAELKGYKKKITDALTRKLHSSQLPFTLKTDADTYEYDGVMEDVGEKPIALIPLSIVADALHAKDQVDDKIFNKSIVVGTLYLVICRGGDTANNWEMIGGIPISGFTIVKGEARIPSKKEEADAYVQMMEKRINELDFNDLKKYLQNLGAKKIPNTYEVVDVSMSSKKAPQIFGNLEKKIQALIGTYYSVRFQEKNKNAVVYPPMMMIGKNTGGDMSSVGNKSAADSVSDSIYSLTGGKSTSGATMTLSMPNPNHKITLDFAGAAWQQLSTKKESSVTENRGYKALLKSRIDNQGEKAVDAVKSVLYVIPKTGTVDDVERERLSDIYTELLIRLSDMLIGGKK